ncbi:adhesin [Bacillus cereus]|uniref:adhesin n=1 Tax=Bacillus cereus TaxID=1396 RepID=UPI000BF65A06|nr:adhesin [Bacillus cereus]PER04302.1 adhesin [Bacillus cereus]PEX04946.1 adhesin [Bacillus cereus]PFF11205.1 adhesin [Bacillus cereus]PGL06641.1 adhesin [Bacillus cereus]PGN84723.1 adhesin [Bacillus cereus]
MPLDYSKILKKVLLTTTVTTLSVGVVTGCSLFSSEKKSTKTASVSKKKKDSEKEKKKDEKKDESKNETNENLNTNDFDEIIDNAKRSSDQNLAGIIENNKTKKKFDDLTDSIATAAINSDRNLASVIDGDKSSNRFSDLNNSIVSATNNPSVSDNKDSKNFVFGGDLNINDGVAIADNSIPPINNDKKPPTSSDTSGGEVKPPTGGEGNNGGGTKPPTGGDNDGGGTTKPEKDTVAPVITAKQGVTVYVGDSLNTGDLVDVRDNKDPNPEVTVGAYDTSKVGEIQVTVTATDASGNSSSTTVTVNVVEKEEEKDTEAPVITVKQGVTVYVGDSLNAGDLVDVRDNKDPNPVVTVGAYDTSEAGEIQVTVTATDASGNSSSTTVTVKVVEKEEEKDTEAPVITVKQGVTVHVGDSLNTGDLVDVRDNKDPNPVVTVGAYDTSKAGEIQVIVTATDASGNSSSTTVTVKVVEKEEEKDTEAPVITAKQDVTVHVGDSLNAEDLVEVKDNKDSNPVVTVGVYDTSKPGTISIQVTATDNAGNSSTVTVTVKVVEKEEEKDTEAPVITAKQVVTVHVGDKLSPGSLASVKDNKDSNPVVTVGAYDTSKPGTISVQVTATDKAGNSSTETVNVVVLEKEKPEQKTAETTSKEQGNGLLALNSNDVAK